MGGIGAAIAHRSDHPVAWRHLIVAVFIGLAAGTVVLDLCMFGYTSAGMYLLNAAPEYRVADWHSIIFDLPAVMGWAAAFGIVPGLVFLRYFTRDGVPGVGPFLTAGVGIGLAPIFIAVIATLFVLKGAIWFAPATVASGVVAGLAAWAYLRCTAR